MMEEKSIVLPKRREMCKRLLELDNRLYFVKNFYPYLLKYAGKELSFERVAHILVSANYKYAEICYSNVSVDMTLNIPALYYDLIPNIITVFTNNGEEADELKELFNKASEKALLNFIGVDKLH